MTCSIHSCSRKHMLNTIKTLALVIVLIQYTQIVASGECTPEPDELTGNDDEKREALRYKAGSIGSILIAGAVGVSLPLLGNKVPALSPENDMFFMIKAFAAGVILSTAFVHILPDAFDKLSSPCLSANPWGDFPFAGFVAMLSSIATLMMDTIATGFYKRQHYATSSSASTATDHRRNNKSKTRQQVIRVDIEELGGAHQDDEHPGHVHVHTHTTHGHAHGSAADLTLPELIRHRIISQVLELGIVVHSVIIGISLGASESLGTIKPLMVALSFHQFFEGMGLGGCICQAQFKSRSAAMMATFFSLTTPLGIAVGIGICNVYTDNSPTAIVVEGILNSASAGILIYMALVDLLAADFMNPRMQTNLRLQIGSNVSLLLGAACMSLLAKWA